MEKEEIVSIVEKVVSTLQENKPAEAVAKAEPTQQNKPAEAVAKAEPTQQNNDKVIIDLQKSYEKLSGQLDEINRKLTAKEQAPVSAEKKPLVI